MDVALVGDLERAALEQLATVLAGTSACRVPDGRRALAKHWEGRVSALADVRRAMTAGTPAGTALDRARAQWTERMATTRGDEWSSYSAGGLAALEALATALQVPPAPRRASDA